MNPGDAVEFKTGSPEMTIVNDRGDGTVLVTWFDSDKQTTRTEVVHKVALRPVADEPFGGMLE